MSDPAILSPFVRALGRGPGRTRALTQAEAHAAMAAILSGEAAPEAVGALLMLMRFRGENAEELAGFVQAMRDRLGPWQGLQPALDWPSYASGRSRGAPLFVLAAKLVAQSGASVLLHGWNSAPNADIRAHLGPLGIETVTTPEAAAKALARARIAYLPLEALDPAFMRVLRLRDVLGLRSPMNTALKLFNPGGAAAGVQGVFHPPYRALQQDAAALMGARDVLVLKGGGGEFERHPGKAVQLFGLRGGDVIDTLAEPICDDTRRLSEAGVIDPAAFWAGTEANPFAAAVVTGTAALALMALDADLSREAAEAKAQALWAARLS